MCECERVSATTASPLVPRACDAGQRRWGGGATRDDGQRQQIFAVLGFFTRSFNPCRCVCVCVCVCVGGPGEKVFKRGRKSGQCAACGGAVFGRDSSFSGGIEETSLSCISLCALPTTENRGGGRRGGSVCMCAKGKGRDNLSHSNRGFLFLGVRSRKKRAGAAPKRRRRPKRRKI